MRSKATGWAICATLTFSWWIGATEMVTAQPVRNPPPFRPGLPPTPPLPPGFPSRPADFPRNRISGFSAPTNQIQGTQQGFAAAGQGGFGVGGQGGFGGIGGLGGGGFGGFGGLGGGFGGLGGLGGGFGGLGGGGFGGFGGGKQFGFDGGMFDHSFRQGVGLIGSGSVLESGMFEADSVSRSLDLEISKDVGKPTQDAKAEKGSLRAGKFWALPSGN